MIFESLYLFKESLQIIFKSLKNTLIHKYEVVHYVAQTKFTQA